MIRSLITFLNRIDVSVEGWFKKFIGIEDTDNHKPLYQLFRAAAVFVGIVFLINLFAIGTSNFGEWGDFFGGVLNPILTFLMFMALLFTIVLQQSELRDTRKELKRSADALSLQNEGTRRQIFEGALFQMLSLHNEILNSIRLPDKHEKVLVGRECFSTFNKEMRRRYESEKNNMEDGEIERKESEIVRHAYLSFLKLYRDQTNHYFRLLYNILKFVSESDLETKRYIRVIRAQLSDQELLLLFYRCFHSHQSNLRKLVEEFELLRHLPAHWLFDPSHRNLLDQIAYGLHDEPGAS